MNYSADCVNIIMFGALVAMTMRDDSFIILRTRYAGA